MIRFIEKIGLNKRLKLVDEVAQNRILFNKYYGLIENEHFIESDRLIKLHNFNPDKLYPLDGRNNNSMDHLKDLIARLVRKESGKALINLREIRYLSDSSDNKFFSEFTNIKDWWNYTLYHGQSKRKYEEIPEYLRFSVEKIQSIVNSSEFKSIHKNCSLFEWHNGYLAEHADGAHRMAHVITMCDDLDVNVYYDMHLTSYSINREVMKHLLEQYSIYIIFSDKTIDCYNPICSFFHKVFENRRGAEAYSYEVNSSEETKHILLIRKDNILKILCDVFDENINSQEEIVKLLKSKKTDHGTQYKV